MSAYTQIPKLLVEYERVARAVRLRLLADYHPKLVWGLVAETRHELAGLVSAVPYIGEGHVWQSSLDTGVMSLALYRVLQKNGFRMEEAARLTADTFQAYLHSYPKPLRRAYGWYFFCALHEKSLGEGARRSQQRRYPGDWVFTYIEGDAKTFDFGVDVHECAILKFYQAHEAEEFVPYVCRFDDVMGRMLGLGFARTGTLAGGAEVCDCRWKYQKRR